MPPPGRASSRLRARVHIWVPQLLAPAGGRPPRHPPECPGSPASPPPPLWKSPKCPKRGQFCKMCLAGPSTVTWSTCEPARKEHPKQLQGRPASGRGGLAVVKTGSVHPCAPIPTYTWTCASLHHVPMYPAPLYPCTDGHAHPCTHKLLHHYTHGPM